MPCKWTFQVRPLREIIDRYQTPHTIWIDPFAGFCSPANITNDLNPDAPTFYHLEALEFVNSLPNTGRYAGAIFDPPYSLTQVSRSYKDFGLKLKGKENPTGGFPKVKDRIAEILSIGGYVISYGWNTVGMGKTRGFELVEVLVCCHGGNRNDTLVVVERKRDTDGD